MNTALSYRRVYDAVELARWLRTNNAPGRRSVKAIRDLRRVRAERTATPHRPTLQQRFAAHVMKPYLAEIRRRGGETMIDDGTETGVRLSISDRRDGFILLRAEGWRQYTKTNRHRATLAYLCGTDDNGRWTVRVAGTIKTVSGALDAITPAEVKRAITAGRRVDRQGDIYAIATTKAHDTKLSGYVGDLGTNSHWWDAATRTLHHRPEDGRTHAPLHLPHPVRFVQQHSYGHGRGAGRSAAD